MSIKLPNGILLEDTIIDQLKRMDLEYQNTYSNMSIMPDAHYGKGSCIGFTAIVNEGVVPSTVGVDIGCGMTNIVFKIENDDITDFLTNKLTDEIDQNIPSGFHINPTDQREELLNITPSPLEFDFSKLRCFEDACFETTCAREIKKHVKANDREFDPIAFKEEYRNSQLFQEAIEYLKNRIILQLGSLGGGNHFMELSQLDSEHHTWTVHSGSRYLGLLVAEYYQRQGEKLNPIGELKRGTKLFDDYLHDVQLVQNYALKNREFMLIKLFKIMKDNSITKTDIKDLEWINTTHNYISFEDNKYIVRKGAIKKENDKPMILPWNMRDGITIFYPNPEKEVDYPDTNNSLPHGAGRVKGRNQAFKEIDLFEADKAMEGFVSSRNTIEVLDENPLSYKDSNVIKSWIKKTYPDLTFVDGKTIYNFKAASADKSKQLKKKLKWMKENNPDYDFREEEEKLDKVVKTPKLVK